MLLRIMKLIEALLLCLAVKASQAVELKCRKEVTCPRGNTGENVTICIPHYGIDADIKEDDDTCTRLSKCESCKEDLNVYYKCLKGLKSQLCSQKINKNRQKRQLRIHYPDNVPGYPFSERVSMGSSCPTLDSSMLGSIVCDSSDDEETCTGKCWPGYHFVFDLGNEITLTCKEGVWTPWKSFPECRRKPDSEFIFCHDPGVDSNGFRQPATPPSSRGFPQGSRLEYSCDKGYNLKNEYILFCLTSGEWSTSRPSCVKEYQTPKCGHSFIQTTHKILKGTMLGDWPWVVLITDENEGSSSFMCSGAILNDHIVITAAQCVTSGKPLILRFGKHSFRNEDDDEEVLVRKSSRIIIHPDYSNRTLDSSIGLVIFQPPIQYSVRRQPICLPTPESAVQNLTPGRTGYATGWSKTEKGLPPDEMSIFRLVIVSKKHCRIAYAGIMRITSNMICAKTKYAYQNICQDGSGMPFVFYNNKTESYSLEGLYSFGPKRQCNITGKYVVFSKIFRFVPWIIENSRNQ